ncbi:hypothetical protein MMC26_002409 [Xylographa opegraphella]|nr:hypothetical protein [Xylographa opegraphella]
MISNPAPNASHKRKQPASNSHASSTKHNAKRVKLSSARAILAQSSEKALNTNGELDVSAFVKAREYEIKSLEASMGSSKKALTTRAFQQVPRELRRRTASHNVKRVPKRLRTRAAKEMKVDNTPTITARSRNLTSQKRLRIREAKKLQGIAAKVREKRKAARAQKTVGGDEDKQDLPSAIPTKATTGTLAKAPKVVSKFRKRQIHKAWLPTHLYHAKRAHMTPPKEPLWRFAVPLTPTQKSYRATHRAGSMRGCVCWDMSYMSILGVEGVEASLLGVLRCLGVPRDMLVDSKGRNWRRGTRSWKGWIRERDGNQACIAKVDVFWCVQEGNFKTSDLADEITNTKRANERRRMFLRVHPSSFMQLWTEILKVAKMQRPPASVEDLRFEIGSIEVMGPDATEALVGALHPDGSADDELVTPDHPKSIWPSLAAVTNPAALPANALLGFNVSDPRLHHPPRTVIKPQSLSDNEDLLHTLAIWPPDKGQYVPILFDRAARLTASRLLSSQKSINRRKGASMPGSYPSPLPTDPQIPILLQASRPETKNGGQGSWTLLLPWKCVVPVWYSLMYYPLSTGGNPRFGGLREKRQISFEQGIPWFPADYPGTKAGWEWELMEREKRKADWAKRPKGKRIEWESVDLGENRKGEIGSGWACDWERLFSGGPATTVPNTNDVQNKDDSSAQPEVTSDKPASFNIHHVRDPYLSVFSADRTSSAIAPVSISLLHRGVPTTCARIYRLPSSNHSRLAQWLALASSPCTKSHKTSNASFSKPFRNAALREKRAALAASLLGPPSHDHTGPHTAVVSAERFEAGDPRYPVVPDEEDLVGFITTGNFNLGEGRGTGIGNVFVGRMLNGMGKVEKEGLCIVREAGSGIGRLARWAWA